MRFPGHGRELVERLIKCFGCAVNLLPIPRTQAFTKRLHLSDDLIPVRIAKFIALVTKVLSGVPQKQPAVFNLTRCKHGSQNDEARMNDKVRMTKRHRERIPQAREESKDPVELLFGFAAGFLDFARNDGRLFRHSSLCF